MPERERQKNKDKKKERYIYIKTDGKVERKNEWNDESELVRSLNAVLTGCTGTFGGKKTTAGESMG